MTTPDYTIQTSFTLAPKPSENFSETSNLTPTTPSTLSDSPLINSGKSLSDCDQMNAICEQLITEKETMMKQIELSNTEVSDLRNKLLQAARQKQALNKAHVKITELETRLSEITEENAKLKVQNQQNEELVKLSQKYQIVMDQNIQEIRMLTTKRVEAEKAIHQLQQENLQYKLKLEKVLNALNTSEESKEDLWATIEEQEKQIDINQALSQEIDELKKQLNEAQAQNSQDLKNEFAQSQKDVRQLKLHNVQLQALLKEKCQELEQTKQDLPSIRIESERSLTERFLPGTPSAACSRSMTTVPKTPNSNSERVKFIRMKKESMTPTIARSVDIEKKILSVLTERRKLTKQNDNLVEKIKEQRKEIDQLNYFTTILNAPQSARERRVHVSRLPTEWEERDQASPVKPFSRLIVKREIAQEELRRKNKSAALLERGNAPIHAL